MHSLTIKETALSGIVVIGVIIHIKRNLTDSMVTYNVSCRNGGDRIGQCLQPGHGVGDRRWRGAVKMILKKIQFILCMLAYYM